jgi:fatty acid desaturase
MLEQQNAQGRDNRHHHFGSDGSRHKNLRISKMAVVTASAPYPRDYSLEGPLNKRALDLRIANGDWYKTPIPRAKMKELMQRSDGPATRDTIIWIAALIVSGGLGAYFWDTWWCVPFFIIYGVLYGSAADSRWHECGHGTAFRTQWKNDLVYQIACFMLVRNPTVWRWSHSRHHTDTIIVGRDPEIITMRPPEVAKVLLNFFGLLMIPQFLWNMVRYAGGRLSDGEKDYILKSERSKVAFVARIWVAIYAAAIGLALYTWSFLPLMFIGLPSFYGCWHMLLTGLTQHIGLAEDVLDHRLNSRTMYINPFSRFIYWNMNYHVEHHMFPMVPYHALPKLHEEIKNDCPPPYHGFWACYREIIPTLWRQLKDPDYFVQRILPPTANPTPPLPNGK